MSMLDDILGGVRKLIDSLSVEHVHSGTLAFGPGLVLTDSPGKTTLTMHAPNTFSNDSGTLGPSAVSLRWDSPAVTRVNSGFMFVTGGFVGTQNVQAVVSVTLYRDFGTGGQVQFDTFTVAPGGIGSLDWSGHHHHIDHLTDNNAHTYTIIATPSGGSTLTATSADFDIFEIGAPA